jgi:hypothetical protein
MHIPICEDAQFHRGDNAPIGIAGGEQLREDTIEILGVEDTMREIFPQRGHLVVCRR